MIDWDSGYPEKEGAILYLRDGSHAYYYPVVLAWDGFVYARVEDGLAKKYTKDGKRCDGVTITARDGSTQFTNEWESGEDVIEIERSGPNELPATLVDWGRY